MTLTFTNNQSITIPDKDILVTMGHAGTTNNVNSIEIRFKDVGRFSVMSNFRCPFDIKRNLVAWLNWHLAEKQCVDFQFIPYKINLPHA